MNYQFKYNCQYRNLYKYRQNKLQIPNHYWLRFNQLLYVKNHYQFYNNCISTRMQQRTIKILSFQKKSNTQNNPKEKDKILHGKPPYFSFVILSSLNGNNLACNKLQNHILSKHSEEIILARSLKDKDLLQIIRLLKTQKVYCLVDHEVDDNLQETINIISKELQKSSQLNKKQKMSFDVEFIILLKGLEQSSMRNFTNPLITMVTSSIDEVIRLITERVSSYKHLRQMASTSTLNEGEIGNYQQMLSKPIPNLYTNQKRQDKVSDVEYQTGTPGVGSYDISNHKAHLENGKFSKESRDISPQKWKKK